MLVVLSDAKDGGEDEFNAWYTGRHLDDIVAMPGFSSAKRYRLRTLNMGAFSNRYLAIYHIDADDPERAVDDMFALRDTPAMPLSPAFDLDTCNVAIFEECSDEVVASGAGHEDKGDRT